jgi:hypothetical protein
MKKYYQGAKGEQCTMQIVGVCNFNSDTVVFCHFPEETNGIGKKSHFISGGDCCSDCHNAIDGRVRSQEFRDNFEWYLRRSQTRTIKRRLEQGILTLK